MYTIMNTDMYKGAFNPSFLILKNRLFVIHVSNLLSDSVVEHL